MNKVYLSELENNIWYVSTWLCFLKRPFTRVWENQNIMKIKHVGKGK